jgi:hypothetical protein
MTLHEPATFATDVLLAIFSAGFGWRLRSASTGMAARGWWSFMFFFTALAGLAGGVFHAFGPAMPTAWANACWLGTLLALNGTSLGLMQAAAHANLGGTALRLWSRCAWIKAGLFAGWNLAHPVFASAIADYGSALIFLLVVECLGSRRPGASRFPWILAGIAASVLAALVQQMRWAPAPGFNHNDLYHVTQLAALALFYRGARTLPPGGAPLNPPPAAPPAAAA